MEYMTTYQRDEVMAAAKKTANENGSPVCVMYSGLLDVWWLDETPEPLENGDHALHTVVAPDDGEDYEQMMESVIGRITP